jgi:hypothetical protein
MTMLELPFICPRCNKKTSDYVQICRPFECFTCKGWVVLDVRLVGNTITHIIEAWDNEKGEVERVDEKV